MHTAVHGDGTGIRDDRQCGEFLRNGDTEQLHRERDLLMDLRGRWHLDRSEPEPHIHHRGDVHLGDDGHGSGSHLHAGREHHHNGRPCMHAAVYGDGTGIRDDRQCGEFLRDIDTEQLHRERDLLMDLRGRWHLDRSEPEPHIHHRGDVHLGDDGHGSGSHLHAGREHHHNGRPCMHAAVYGDGPGERDHGNHGELRGHGHPEQLHRGRDLLVGLRGRWHLDRTEP